MTAPLTEDFCQELIETILREHHLIYLQKGPETVERLTQLEPLAQVQMALALLRWYQANNQGTYQHQTWVIVTVLFQLLKQTLPFSLSDILELIKAMESDQYLFYAGAERLPQLIGHYLKEHPITAELHNAVETICQRLEGLGAVQRKSAAKLRQLFPDDHDKYPILAGEPWADQALSFLTTLAPDPAEPWRALLKSSATISGSKPSAKWLNLALGHRERIGLEPFKQALLTWFPLVDRPRTKPLVDWRGMTDLIADQNAEILRALVWLCADRDDADLARALSSLAISAYRKVPQIGPRCVKLGNACIWALSQMPTAEALAQLALLKVRVKFGTAQKGIEKAFLETANRAGISREEIEELSVPTYGLSEVGRRRETLGDFTAELVVTGTHSTELRWLRADGKPQKSIPQAVKTEYADELKALKQAEKDIQKMLPAQAQRLEALYPQPRAWDFVTWQERYLDHPLMGCLARRLLWQFELGENHAVGIWYDGALRDRTGEVLPWLTAETKVTLWHPITASPETIQAWRGWLMEREIQQPFKQAHREIYLLTPAEEATRVYSNRFAAHILKQHQFNALCAQRGWKNKLRLLVDDDYPPACLVLPQWNLRAEFWIEGIGDEYGSDTNESGTFLYLTTDQVRFYPIQAPDNYAHAAGGGYGMFRQTPVDPLPLTEIPALVLSEVLRDVDLFVGVASVGNDPNWADGGPEGHHRDYWYDYSFGELSATAQTRRQVLEALIPRLKKIRDRCSFQERFLVVQGDLRTYKIHLGSGNILMEPNDQYLCIVKAPERGGGSEPIFLPFEGDKTLAVILSKAFLLAEDRKITDPTILRQIQP